MIVVTGGAGFIGSAIVWKLNTLGRNDIIIVDSLGKDEKWKNLVSLKYFDFWDKELFLNAVLDDNLSFVPEAIIHMGANSSTTEKDADHLIKNNYEYTKNLAIYSLEKNIRFVYASSAATYGSGENGFSDEEDFTKLKPLNMYGYSKQMFDVWALNNNLLDKIAGVKYFNVYGPNETHKGDMRSVVHKAFEQVKDTGKVKLFKSNHPDYKDGEQKRDFIYVKDAVDMTLHLVDNRFENGIFNVGSGNAKTWIDLVTALFNALNKPVNIEFIDLPEHLADKYQNFTEATINRIKNSGYTKPISTLEEGVTDYVQNYLIKNKYLGE